MKIANTMLHICQIIQDEKGIFPTIKKSVYNLITEDLMNNKELQEWVEHLDGRKQPYVVVSAYTKRPKKEGFLILMDMRKFYNSDRQSEGSDQGVSGEVEQQIGSKVDSLELDDLEMFEDRNNV